MAPSANRPNSFSIGSPIAVESGDADESSGDECDKKKKTLSMLHIPSRERNGL